MSNIHGMGAISSMILDDMKYEDEREYRNRRRKKSVVLPTALSKKSKYYTRPIFKEPGSKLPTVEENQKRSPGREKQWNQVAIIRELRGDIETKRSLDSDTSVIQPISRTNFRLKSIVGKQAGPDGLKNEDEIGALEKRLMKGDWQQREAFDSGASVVTCSNLDNLEAKRLHAYGFERQPSGLSTIRREVKQMVGCVLQLGVPMDNEKKDSSKEAGGEESRNARDVPSVVSNGIMIMWSEAPAFELPDFSYWKCY